MPGNVALVAAGPDQALRWQIGLSAQLCDTITTLDAEDVLAETTTHPVPDVFVIAADLGRSGQGLRLMSELRSRPATRHAAICIVVDPDAPEVAAMALDLGANDLIPTDFRPEELALRVAKQLKRKRLADRLRASVTDGLRLAVIDPLTGLYNRRYALPQLARIADRALDTGRNFAVMVLDLDRFKSVNDTWGHAAGDAVLVEVAARLSANLRAVDLIARYGGEEFLIALPDTTLEAARIAAERLRQGIEERPIRLPGGAGEASVTVSIGLAMGTGTARGDRPDRRTGGPRAARLQIRWPQPGHHQPHRRLSPRPETERSPGPPQRESRSSSRFRAVALQSLRKSVGKTPTLLGVHLPDTVQQQPLAQFHPRHRARAQPRKRGLCGRGIIGIGAQGGDQAGRVLARGAAHVAQPVRLVQKGAAQSPAIGAVERFGKGPERHLARHAPVRCAGSVDPAARDNTKDQQVKPQRCDQHPAHLAARLARFGQGLRVARRAPGLFRLNHPVLRSPGLR